MKQKQLYCFAVAMGTVADSCLKAVCLTSGGSTEESSCVQGAGRDQLVDVLLIGW